MANGRLPAVESAEAAILTPPRALTRSTAQIRLRNTASPVLANGPLKPSIMAILIGADVGVWVACANVRVGTHKASASNFRALREYTNILKSLLNTADSLTESVPAVVDVERRAVYRQPVAWQQAACVAVQKAGRRHQVCGGWMIDNGCRRPSLWASSTAELTPIFSKICDRWNSTVRGVMPRWSAMVLL